MRPHSVFIRCRIRRALELGKAPDTLAASDTEMGERGRFEAVDDVDCEGSKEGEATCVETDSLPVRCTEPWRRRLPGWRTVPGDTSREVLSSSVLVRLRRLAEVEVYCMRLRVLSVDSLRASNSERGLSRSLLRLVRGEEPSTWPSRLRVVSSRTESGVTVRMVLSLRTGRGPGKCCSRTSEGFCMMLWATGWVCDRAERSWFKYSSYRLGCFRRRLDCSDHFWRGAGSM
jgi:hypothetical protein